MLRICRALIPVLAGLAVTADALTAQTIRSPYRHVDERQAVGFFGGYIFTDRGELELGPESGLAFGARYSIRLGGSPFSAEANVGLFPTTRVVFDTVGVDLPLAEVGEADLTLLLADASLRFDLTGPHVLRIHAFRPGRRRARGRALRTTTRTRISPPTRFRFGTRFAGHVVQVSVVRVAAPVASGRAKDIFWKLRRRTRSRARIWTSPGASGCRISCSRSVWSTASERRRPFRWPVRQSALRDGSERRAEPRRAMPRDFEDLYDLKNLDDSDLYDLIVQEISEYRTSTRT